MHVLLQSVARLVLLFIVAAPGLALARAHPRALAIMGEDGTPVANHRIAAELAGRVENLPGIVVAGNPKGDVTITEFYDLNCPYCRKASTDLHRILRADNGIRLVLVPFPVLGIPSILATRVELAVAKLATPEQFYDFHRKIYAGRGVVDANRALAVAKELALDLNKLIELANESDITETMKAHIRLGDVLGLIATPSYIIKDVAIVGHPGQASLQRIVQSLRRCGELVC